MHLQHSNTATLLSYIEELNWIPKWFTFEPSNNFFPKASSMLGFSFRRLREERDRMSGSGGRAVDGRWTGCGRAGAAEIAWEEATK